MKIAMFISGRLTCYKENLIPVLYHIEKEHNIDLFISVNNISDNYYLTAEKLLNKWLKNIQYNEFIIPDIFIKNINNESLLQNVNGKYQPYTVLSCFYNDKNAYAMIKEYEKINNIKYDLYVKFRSDMIFDNINDITFNSIDNKDLIIYSCIPPCEIYFWGNRNYPRCISDAFAYGNELSMNIYTNTYDFIIDTNNKLNGNYRINYEPCLTESIYNTIFNNIEDYKNALNNSKIKIIFFYCPYIHNLNRMEKDKIKHNQK